MAGIQQDVKRIIIFLALGLIMLTGWCYWAWPVFGVNAAAVTDPPAMTIPAAAHSVSQNSSLAVQAGEPTITTGVPGRSTTSIYYPEKFAADGSLLPLLERRREYSRKEIQAMLKTPEELQRDWWHEYSRQVPRLRVKTECASVGNHSDIALLKTAAESGDRCAMGNYANVISLRWANDNVYADPEKLKALLPEAKRLQEYFALSAVAFRFAATGRACTAINYFNDREEALAWRMINHAYWNGHPPLEICRVQEVMSDQEVVYQRALALALLYIDYYQLGGW